MSFAFLVKSSTKENVKAPNLILLESERLVIGRYGDIRIDTAKRREVSKRHAAIAFSEKDGSVCWTIEDLDSMNGTFVNCRKVRRWNLSERDEVVFGGGSTFIYGDMIESSNASDCRYMFALPEPVFEFSKGSNWNEVLPLPDDCQECSICYLPMLKRTQLPCEHVFCRKCIRGWHARCATHDQEFACPICRRAYRMEECEECEMIREEAKIIVNNVEPLLRRLGICSVADLRKLSIMKPWSEDDRATFWNWVERVSKSKKSDKKEMFRWLTQSNYRAVFNANDEGLRAALSNFEHEAVETGLRETVMWIVQSRLH